MDDYTTKDPKAFDKIERMAIRQRWPASPEKLQAAIDRQFEIASSAESSNREATSAFRAIAQAVGQNQKDEHKVADIAIAKRNSELAAIAADLEIEIGVVEDAQRAGGGRIEDAG